MSPTRVEPEVSDGMLRGVNTLLLVVNVATEGRVVYAWPLFGVFTGHGILERLLDFLAGR